RRPARDGRHGHRAGDADADVAGPPRRPFRHAVANRSPTKDISTPVTAVRRGPPTASWITGNAATPTRAARSKRPVVAHTAPKVEIAITDARGAATTDAPTNVSTLRPPRPAANAGTA